MGMIRPFEEERIEIKEFKQMLSSCSSVQRRKDDDRFHDQPEKLALQSDHDVTETLICVTSGVSFVGIAIVNRLLLRGYSVRVLVTNEEELEKLREIAGNIDITNGTTMLTAVTADINEVQSLSDAFNGCQGVFHTAAFIDPAGLSGYSKAMAGIELKTCENVMVACSRTTTVRRCVLTSSLVACLWREDSSNCDNDPSSSSSSSTIINHHSWSDESLWYALGKLRAEKCAWRIIGEQKRVRLVTICAGLVTGPEFPHRNPTSTFAYLKGVQHMYAKGLLATVDVHRLADAHLLLFEAMDDEESFGRYICFDNVVQCQTEADDLARQLGSNATIITGNNPSPASPRFQLSNLKLSKLMMTTLGCNSNNNVI
ncbi:cinnamoyl-CoA reductase-like SNL6 isoform X2 [Impatiens glandulifera]|uniref:cinnamoyl-CoA reductase-like SNL6 isoform X2 n=1 Tax=Impatiens glandulifera TaxID=253017 RepID=UPI001FB0865A|nr:cinnamoyl-CoA reductase-like SNL6 isoform X2 [Impatiens glandulifera]